MSTNFVAVRIENEILFLPFVYNMATRVEDNEEKVIKYDIVCLSGILR